MEAQTLTITPVVFNTRVFEESEIPDRTSTASGSEDLGCMRRDAIAKSLFERKRRRALVGDEEDIHVGLTSSESN